MKSRGGFTKPNEALGIEESKDGLMDVTPKAGSAPPLPLSLEAFGETIQGHGKTLLRRFLAIGVGRAHTLPPPYHCIRLSVRSATRRSVFVWTCGPEDIVSGGRQPPNLWVPFPSQQ
jgi:hypothetical protein